MDDEPGVFPPLEPVPSRTRWFLRIVGRLRQGVTAERAQAEMTGIARRIAAANLGIDKRQGILISSMHRHVVQDATASAPLLAGAAAFVLLVACANVSSLLLARGAGRGRELATRAALGATRGRLVRQLLTESIVTALIGGALGLGLAYAVLPALAAIAPQWSSYFSRLQDNGLRIDASVLWFTCGVSLAAAVLFGALPALRNTDDALRATARSRSGGASNILLIVEVALSFVLLAGAGLMLNSLHHLGGIDPGFRADGLLTLGVSLPDGQYKTPESKTDYLARARGRLGRLPGARGVAAADDLPLTLSYSTSPFAVDDQPGTERQATFRTVTPEYFRVTGITMLAGRPFADADGPQAPAVAVVNEAFVKAFLADRSALDTALVVPRLTFEHGSAGTETQSVPERVQIVAVIADARQMWVDVPARPEILVPFAQRPQDAVRFVIRAAHGIEPASLVAQARSALREINRDVPVTEVRTMTEWIGRGFAANRFILALVGIASLVALALSAAGLYGMVSHSVARRSHEIAVRLAVGAPASSVIGGLARQHMAWVLVGLAAGWAGAAASTRLIARYLYGVTATDGPTYVTVAALLAGVALIAVAIPALRVTAVDPVTVLRSE
jgi:putative ABC transport system permease protein